MGRATKIFSSVNWKYALGEILLLVIGILLAVQINNWNTNRGALKNEAVVLNRLKNEITSNQKELIFRDRANEGREATFKFIDSLLSLKTLSYDGKLKAINLPRIDFPFVPVQSTYEEMHNTGLIYRLSNDSIRNSIVEYYRELSEITNEINKQNRIINEQFMLPNFLKLRENIARKIFRGSLQETDISWLDRPKDKEDYISFILYYRLIMTTETYYLDIVKTKNDEILEMLSDY